MRNLLFFLFAFTLFSCGNTKWETKEFDGFSLEIPDYLKESQKLHSDADVQYENAVKEVYFVLIREPKETVPGFTYESYTELVKNNYKENTSATFENEQQAEINGMKCLLYDAYAQMEGSQIFSCNGIFESEKNFYQVICWTLKSRQDEYEADMKKMVSSLKEL